MENRKIVELDLNDILPNRFQPRIKFNETSITELAESIREHGVIQPIVVRPLGDRYEIIAGERRYKASVLAGKQTIPAIVTMLNDKDSAEVALIENVQRQDLTPIEEAISYKKILDMGYLTQEELAEKLGKTQSTVANKLRLLNLDDSVQEALLETKISERHARSLLKISNKENQRKMLDKIIKERLTVRRTDEEISKMMNENKNVEILDLGNNMQNTNNKNTLNIPTSPIVEEGIPEPFISEWQTNQDNTTNPGFMNVENIEKNAESIQKEPLPVANIDALLKPSGISESMVEPSNINHENMVEEQPAESILKPGKFFNFSDLENETPKFEEAETQTVIGNPIDSNNILTTPNLESENQINNVYTGVETNSLDNHNFITDFANQTMNEKPAPIIPQNPEPLIQTPIMEPISNQTISVPSYSELDAALYGAPIELTTPSMGVETNSNIAGNASNMKQAIELIRECANKIEALGFKIETEEYDFEDMYQAIFKIDKK